MSITRTKIGDERHRTVILKAGQYASGNEVITLSEDMNVPVVERFVWTYPAVQSDPAWKTVLHKWDEATPVAKPKELTTIEHRPSWLTRLWWFLTGGRVPRARVVKS